MLVFTEKNISDISGLAKHKVRQYAMGGVIEPEIFGANGQGSNRIYSEWNLVQYLVCREIYRMGINLPKSRVYIQTMSFVPNRKSYEHLKKEGFEDIFFAVHFDEKDKVTSRWITVHKKTPSSKKKPNIKYDGDLFNYPGSIVVRIPKYETHPAFEIIKIEADRVAARAARTQIGQTLESA